MAALPVLPHSPLVLVVDDMPAVRTIARRSLEAYGYQVMEAENGEDALALLSQGVPADLVLADLQMPKMDGLRLAAELKARFPGSLVLFMSGYAHLGITDLPGPVLPKPFMPEQLVASVRQLLMGPQPRSA
jgi:CheY-like chemotaxis protein